MLKILVTGSDGQPPSISFAKLCHSLGCAIATSKNKLMVLSDASFHADRFVLTGYISRVKKEPKGVHEVIVSRGNTTNPENPDRPKFPEERGEPVKFRDFDTDGDYPLNSIAVLMEADVIIVIGGREEKNSGSKLLADVAFAMNKPIVPIKCFGGMGEALWNKLRPKLKGLNAFDGNALAEFANDTSVSRAEVIVRICEHLIAADQREVPLSHLLSTEIACLIIWTIVWLTGYQYVRVGMLVAMVSMAVFGTVLRSLVRLLRNPVQRLTLHVFLIEFGLGIAMGFLYMVLFELGAGEISPNHAKLMADGTFSSTVLVVSVLAVSVSFLLEEHIAKASRILSEFA